ncbi:MAG: twin-arginine translocation signal domain-containing protein, partial [Planctomycetota bacterium]
MSRFSYTRRDFLKAAGLGLAVTTLPGCATVSHRSTARDKRPNILFFFPDQHRFDWLGHNRDLPVR